MIVTLPSLSEEDLRMIAVTLQTQGTRLVDLATEQARDDRATAPGAKRTPDKTVRQTLALGAMLGEVASHVFSQVHDNQAVAAPVQTTVAGEPVVTADTLRAAAEAGQPAPVRAPADSWRATVTEGAALGDGQVAAEFADDLGVPSTERTT